MKREDRFKATNLEAILTRHREFEKRTLSDLRRVGFRFTTIDQAARRLKAQRSMPGFTQEQLDLAIAVLDKQKTNQGEAA